MEQAPVLLLSNVLSHEFCQELMEVWETQGNVVTGVEQTVSGQRKEVAVAQAKRRRDHTVQDRQLLTRITENVGRRIMPEVRKAFSFRATRFEGFKIAYYDSQDQGFFAPHRDNLSPVTAHRRFALSLNLNDGYEGGDLRFPEYGPHLYRPPPGGAVVFSGSILHEALPVTKGHRFVLLSFLFGEADVRARSSSSEKIDRNKTETRG